MLMAIGDLHIGCLRQYVPDLYKRQLRVLQNVLDYAVTKNIGHVFLMGDVYDSPSPPNHIQIAVRRLLSKYNGKIHFHIIIGNHDWESVEHHALQIIKDLGTTGFFNFTVYSKPKVIRVDGVRLFICSHPHVIDAPDKKIHWCLGHFGWNNAKADNGRPIQSDNAPRGRWILGDFHTHQSGERYVYAGSLSQITWGEKLPKGVILFDEDDWQFKPMAQSYKLGVAEVNSDKDLLKLDDTVLWSVRTSGGYTLPIDFKRKHSNIVHLTATRRRKDLRAAVLLAKEDSVLRNPMRLLQDYVVGHKSSLSRKEVKFAMRTAKRIYAQVLRK